MSRSQGAANGGWQGQRQSAGEADYQDPRTLDPRTGGRPAQHHQHPQHGQYPQQGHAQPQYQQAPQQPVYAQPPSYAEPRTQPPSYPQQGYHYPQQHGQPPQYAPPAQAAPAPQQHPGRQSLSSLDSARNAQPTHEFPRTQQPQYGQRAAPPQDRRGYQGEDPIQAAVGYRQPAAPAASQYGQRGAHAAPRDNGYAAAPAGGYDAWPNQGKAPAAAPYGQDRYAMPGDGQFAGGQAAFNDPLQQSDWAMSAAYGELSGEQHGYRDEQQHGYEQPHGNALEPNYNHEEAGAYEAEEPRRGSWTMRIAGAVVVAIGLGYGLAQAYKAVLGSTGNDGAPPVIASDDRPARERPLDPGGKQFPHTDSKVLGRLGDEGSSAGEQGNGGLSESDSSNGSRKVTTLVVGRDGSIEPPAAEPAHEQAEPEGTVSVPGLTVVDAFGGGSPFPQQQQRRAPAPTTPAPTAQAPTQEAEPPRQMAAREEPPPPPRVNVKSTRVVDSTASLPEESTAPPPAKRQKVAAAPKAADEATESAGANGYVVVLASVPASGSSRLDALKKFADMQQQYGSVLANKTPDVRETTLAGKGAYHRLLVGPPGSRSQASALCGELKSAGYKDCWVTAY